MAAKSLTPDHWRILHAVMADECLDSTGRRLGVLTPWLRRKVTSLSLPEIRRKLYSLANAGFVEHDRRPHKATLRWLITDSGREAISSVMPPPQ